MEDKEYISLQSETSEMSETSEESEESGTNETNETTETTETKDCYICLEECSHLSPCECKHPIHTECLQQARVHNTYCTICRKEYNDGDDEYEDEDDEDEDDEEEERGDICCMFILLCPTLYFASGFIGQLLLALFGVVCGFQTTLSQVHNMTMFMAWLFSWEFCLSSLCFNVLCWCSLCSIQHCKYK